MQPPANHVPDQSAEKLQTDLEQSRAELRDLAHRLQEAETQRGFADERRDMLATLLDQRDAQLLQAANNEEDLKKRLEECEAHRASHPHQAPTEDSAHRIVELEAALQEANARVSASQHDQAHRESRLRSLESTNADQRETIDRLGRQIQSYKNRFKRWNVRRGG
jgi:chromosome segregation ATPase